MSTKQAIVTVFLLLSFLGLYAQRPFDARRVNVHFIETPLKVVLQQLSQQYDIQFSYGNDHLKLHKRISFSSENKPLEETLKILFEQNDIVYASIGGQMVLKSKKRDQRIKERAKRRKRREKRDQQTLERERLFDFDIHSEIITTLSEPPEEEEEEERIVLSTQTIEPLVAQTVEGDAEYQNQLNSEEASYVEPRKLKKRVSAQFSLFPFLSTNGKRLRADNIFSLNFFWGINRGVNGLEIGIFANTIRRNIHGIQIGGLFNTAGGHLYGAQFSGLFNFARGHTVGFQIAGLSNLGSSIYGAQISTFANIARDVYGFQLAGISNMATDAYGLQVAGLFNFANGRLLGTQVAGIGNIAWGGKSAVQFAGVFNKSAQAQLQIGGFANFAQCVDGAQIGGANVAKSVNGVQAGIINYTEELDGMQLGILNISKNARGLMFGLINVVDSIKGVPIGIINIVKKNGYNKFEIAGGDAMYLNFGAKFGSKRLYHIIHSGWRVTSSNVYSWSLGLGVGTILDFNRRLGMSFELLCSHVNEDVFWVEKFNLLNQFKLALDFKTKGRLTFFVGPTFNLHVSNIYNPDTQRYGTEIAPYTFYDVTTNKSNVKMWIGVVAGIRF